MHILFKILPFFFALSLSAFEHPYQELIYLKGESLSAADVMRVAEQQLGIRIVNREPDAFGHRKDYDDVVSFKQLLKAVKDYYRNFNGVGLELKTPGNRRYVLMKKGGLLRQDELLLQASDDQPNLPTMRLELDPLIEMSESEGLLAAKSFMDDEIDDEWLALPDANASVGTKVDDAELVSLEETLSLPRELVYDDEEDDALGLKVEIVGHYKKKAGRTLPLEDFEAPEGLVDVDAQKEFLKEGVGGLTFAERLTELSPDLPWLDALTSPVWETRKLTLTPLLASTISYPFVASYREGLSLSWLYEHQSRSGKSLDVDIDHVVISPRWSQRVGSGWRLSASTGVVLGQSKVSGRRNVESEFALKDLDMMLETDLPEWIEGVRLAVGPQFKIPMGENQFVNAKALEFGFNIMSAFQVEDVLVEPSFNLVHRADHDLMGEAKSVSFSSSLLMSLSHDTGEYELGLLYAGESYETSFSGLAGPHTLFKMGWRSRGPLPLGLTLYLGSDSATDGMGLSLVPTSF